MANSLHLDILKGGRERWNQWRADNLKIQPDLSETDLSQADLRQADLSGANLKGSLLRRTYLTEANLKGAILSEADLYEATLSEANLSQAYLNSAHLGRATLNGADLRGAHLRRANLDEAYLPGAHLNGAFLRQAILSDADLRRADLSEADLREAYLFKARLNQANLKGADLSGAVLKGAELFRAILIEADLSGADLSGADLSDADLSQADLKGADLRMARLIFSKLIEATLTSAHFWETQRAGWSIEKVICESAYWDKEGKNLTPYGPGDFERFFSEKTRIQIKYANGITPLEIVTLPALIQNLEATHPGSRLRLESIQDASGGAVVTLIIEDSTDSSHEQMEALRAELQAKAEQKTLYLRQTLEEDNLMLKGEVRALERQVNQIFLHVKPVYYLEKGDITLGDKYNTDQAGAVGPNAHAHDMTFNKISGHIEPSVDLSRLAAELVKLREAMSQEAKNTEQHIALGEIAKAEQAAIAKDSSKVVEYLKGAGKWALDTATKIGASIAAEAIMQSTGMKRT